MSGMIKEVTHLGILSLVVLFISPWLATTVTASRLALDSNPSTILLSALTPSAPAPIDSRPLGIPPRFDPNNTDFVIQSTTDSSSLSGPQGIFFDMHSKGLTQEEAPQCFAILAADDGRVLGKMAQFLWALMKPENFPLSSDDSEVNYRRGQLQTALGLAKSPLNVLTCFLAQRAFSDDYFKTVSIGHVLRHRFLWRLLSYPAVEVKNRLSMPMLALHKAFHVWALVHSYQDPMNLDTVDTKKAYGRLIFAEFYFHATDCLAEGGVIWNLESLASVFWIEQSDAPLNGNDRILYRLVKAIGHCAKNTVVNVGFTERMATQIYGDYLEQVGTFLPTSVLLQALGRHSRANYNWDTISFGDVVQYVQVEFLPTTGVVAPPAPAIAALPVPIVAAPPTLVAPLRRPLLKYIGTFDDVVAVLSIPGVKQAFLTSQNNPNEMDDILAQFLQLLPGVLDEYMRLMQLLPTLPKSFAKKLMTAYQEHLEKTVRQPVPLAPRALQLDHVERLQLAEDALYSQGLFYTLPSVEHRRAFLQAMLEEIEKERALVDPNYNVAQVVDLSSLDMKELEREARRRVPCRLKGLQCWLKDQPIIMPEMAVQGRQHPLRWLPWMHTRRSRGHCKQTYEIIQLQGPFNFDSYRIFQLSDNQSPTMYATCKRQVYKVRRQSKSSPWVLEEVVIKSQFDIQPLDLTTSPTDHHYYVVQSKIDHWDVIPDYGSKPACLHRFMSLIWYPQFFGIINPISPASATKSILQDAPTTMTTTYASTTALSPVKTSKVTPLALSVQKVVDAVKASDLSRPCMNLLVVAKFAVALLGEGDLDYVEDQLEVFKLTVPSVCPVLSQLVYHPTGSSSAPSNSSSSSPSVSTSSNSSTSSNPDDMKIEELLLFVIADPAVYLGRQLMDEYIALYSPEMAALLRIIRLLTIQAVMQSNNALERRVFALQAMFSMSARTLVTAIEALTLPSVFSAMNGTQDVLAFSAMYELFGLNLTSRDAQPLFAVVTSLRRRGHAVQLSDFNAFIDPGNVAYNLPHSVTAITSTGTFWQLEAPDQTHMLQRFLARVLPLQPRLRHQIMADAVRLDTDLAPAISAIPAHTWLQLSTFTAYSDEVKPQSQYGLKPWWLTGAHALLLPLRDGSDQYYEAEYLRLNHKRAVYVDSEAKVHCNPASFSLIVVFHRSGEPGKIDVSVYENHVTDPVLSSESLVMLVPLGQQSLVVEIISRIKNDPRLFDSMIDFIAISYNLPVFQVVQLATLLDANDQAFWQTYTSPPSSS